MDSKDLGWALFLGGVAAVGFGGFILYRHKTLAGNLGFFDKEKPKGRLVTEFWKPPPVVDEMKLPNGMKMQHRRANSISIEERVSIIQKMTWTSVMDPEMRKLALSITHNCPERDGKCESEAIYKFVKKNIRYTGDIAPLKINGTGPVEPIDLYQSARRTIEFKGGDCDDFAIFIATMATLNGISCRLRVTAETKSGDWGHIYPILGANNKVAPTKWIAVDGTLPGNNNFGKEVPFAKYLDFPV